MTGALSDWSAPDAMERWQAGVAATQARRAATGLSAEDRAIAELQSASRRAMRGKGGAVDRRARRYLWRPMDMVAIDRRLPFASPRQMLAIAEHHIGGEARRSRRLMGMGGEVPLVNAMAVRLAARWLRRFECACALQAAE